MGGCWPSRWALPSCWSRRHGRRRRHLEGSGRWRLALASQIIRSYIGLIASLFSKDLRLRRASSKYSLDARSCDALKSPVLVTSQGVLVLASCLFLLELWIATHLACPIWRKQGLKTWQEERNAQAGLATQHNCGFCYLLQASCMVQGGEEKADNEQGGRAEEEGRRSSPASSSSCARLQ